MGSAMKRRKDAVTSMGRYLPDRIFCSFPNEAERCGGSRGGGGDAQNSYWEEEEKFPNKETGFACFADDVLLHLDRLPVMA